MVAINQQRFILLAVFCILVTVYISYELLNWTYYTNYDYFDINSLKPNDYNNFKRNYIHTKRELELTKNIILEPKHRQCFYNHPIVIFIHSSGQSTGKYYEKRQVLRKTWVSDVKRYNISVYFVIALNTNDTVNRDLMKESQEYSDIIQFPFHESYYNLTLKAIAILRWICKNCPKHQLILKVDDDVVVNIEILLQNLNKFDKTAIYGSVLRHIGPQRNIGHKWFISQSVYPSNQLPSYMNGPAYIMTYSAVISLLHTIDQYNDHILDIDDLFITGVIAEKTGISRYDTTLIQSDGCLHVCDLYSTAIIYPCITSQKMTFLWNFFKNNSVFLL
ncbi:beta-1,3-galactosyltransferase 1-like [Oppia nitens]|uniref:beta-1,3-galactosyltransferase 1-like n=1 Tax=Oppia nitens TaxID=1686743 RepID=UPI0023DCE4D2|nr:beta-1,3-galactosyltransferase 1-like [Oppia nitens]